MKSENVIIITPWFISRLKPFNSGGSLSKMTAVACRAFPSVIGVLSSPSGVSIVLASRVM